MLFRTGYDSKIYFFTNIFQNKGLKKTVFQKIFTGWNYWIYLCRPNICDGIKSSKRGEIFTELQSRRHNLDNGFFLVMKTKQRTVNCIYLVKCNYVCQIQICLRLGQLVATLFIVIYWCVSFSFTSFSCINQRFDIQEMQFLRRKSYKNEKIQKQKFTRLLFYITVTKLQL